MTLSPPSRTIKARIDASLYRWAWRLAHLQCKRVGEVVEDGLRLAIRRARREWPSEYVEDLPRVPRRRSAISRDGARRSG